MRYLFLMWSLAAGCTFSPSFGDVTCDTEGATRPGQRCEGGVWVLTDAGGMELDATTADGIVSDTNIPDAGQVPDQGTPDMAPLDMAPLDMAADAGQDMACSAESDLAFCARLAATCGMVTDADNCGDMRTVDCGICDPTTETCTNSMCELVPETDQELCAAAGATCDDITVQDRTGAMRTVNCGMCVAPEVCGAGGTPNTCACANANDTQFCTDNGANCGPVTALDPLCNVTRTVNCGTCTAPETCAGGGTASVCGCMESDAEFCTRLARNCGSVTAPDACGVSRTVDCGSCTLPETCAGGGSANVCGCTVANACAATQCGVLDVSLSCANLATADCGGCGAQGSCQANMCVCMDGYAYNGSTCADIDECTLGTDTCDANATCTNTVGGFTCACNPPFTGNGMTCSMPSPPTVEQVVTDTANLSTLTTGTMTAVDDDLYVAFVTLNTGSRSVSSVTGLGLTWTSLGEQCDGTDDQIIDVWTARGTTSGDSNIVVNLSGVPYAAATIVYRITNVPSSGTAGTLTLRNSNGVNGVCNSSNAANSYSFAYTPASSNSLLLVGTVIEEATHTPGANWTEDGEQHRGGAASHDAGLAAMSQANTTGAAVTVAGTLSASRNWITGVYEVTGL